jgi:hypothetical protein
MISEPIIVSGLAVDFGSAQKIDLVATWWRWLAFKAKHPETWRTEDCTLEAWKELNKQIDDYVCELLSLSKPIEGSLYNSGATITAPPVYEVEIPDWTDDVTYDELLTECLRAKGQAS